MAERVEHNQGIQCTKHGIQIFKQLNNVLYVGNTWLS